MKTFIYLVLLFYLVVGILCGRQKLKRDYIYESESDDIDSVSLDTSASLEHGYDDLIELPIGKLNSNRKKQSYVTNWQFSPPIAGDNVREKILIEVTPKPPPSSYRVKQKPKPFSGRHTTRRTTTEPPPPENFQPQWAIDNSYYDKLFLKNPATAKTKPTTTTTTTSTPFPWGHSSYEYESSIKINPNSKPIKPGSADAQEQLNKLFGSPPTFDWGTLRPNVEQKFITPRPSRRPGYLNPNPTVGVTSTEQETVKIKWKPKYTTVPFDFPNDTLSTTTIRTTPRTFPTTTTRPPVREVTTFRIDSAIKPTTTQIPVLLSLFNVTNLVGGAAAVNSIVNGVSNVSGTNDNPISWVTSSVEQEHNHYEYPDENSQEVPLISELLAAANISVPPDVIGNPIRNTDPNDPAGGPPVSTARPALPTRIRNTIDDLKQQLVVFVEELWDRTLYGSGGGGGVGVNGTMPRPGGLFGGKGGGKGGFGGKGGKGKGGGGGGGNTWVGPYRSVLFQFNRFELNVHNGTVDVGEGVIPEPVKKRFTSNRRPQQQQQQNRQSFTRKAHPPLPMFSITDY